VASIFRPGMLNTDQGLSHRKAIRATTHLCDCDVLARPRLPFQACGCWQYMRCMNSSNRCPASHCWSFYRISVSILQPKLTWSSAMLPHWESSSFCGRAASSVWLSSLQIDW
jgi:hypothetical protein